MSNDLTRLNLAALDIDVTHSEILASCYDTDTLRDPSWHALEAAAYKAAYDHFSRRGCPHLEILRKLSDISGATVKPGEYTEGSYIYCPGIRGSIQGSSANRSLRIARRLAEESASTFEIKVRLPNGAPRWGGQQLLLWWTPDAIWEL